MKIGCDTLSKKYGLKEGCCDSCHDEYELGYHDLLEVCDNGEDYLVCCRVYNELEAILMKEQ